MTRRVSVAAFAAGIALCGCTSTPPPVPVAPDALLPATRAEAQLLRDVAGLVRQHAHHAASRQAARYADELRAAIAAANGAAVQDALLAATVVDGDAAAWAQVVRDRAAQPAVFVELDSAIASAQRMLANGDAGAAADIARNAAVRVPFGIGRARAMAWYGFAAAAAGRDDGPSTLRSVAQELSRVSANDAAAVLLIAHARTPSDATWLDAVNAAGGALAARPALATPRLWWRAIAQRPPAVAWPAPVLHSLAVAAFVAGVPDIAHEDGDVLARYAVAEMERRRGDALAAVLAFRTAEEGARSPLTKALCQAGQAKAFAAAGRTGDARSVLAGTVQHELPAARALGLATLGAIELAGDRPVVARALLQQALDIGPQDGWPGRADAMANLGLALLTAGDGDNGVQWLHRARDTFAAAGDHDGLVGCLENEAAWLTGWQQRDATAVQKQIDEVARSGSLTRANAPR